MKKVFILLCFVACGCNPEKKTQRYLFDHPLFSAEYCADKYPVKDSVLVKYDTVLDLGEIEYNQVPDTIRKDSLIYITNKSTKIITKTIRKDSIVFRPNPAEERRLQLLLQKCQDQANTLLDNFNKQTNELAIWQGRAKKRWWLIFALIGGAVVYTGFKLKKFMV